MAIPSANNEQEKKICCAYVPRGTKNNHIAGTYLALKVNRLLPKYMIPQQWESYIILPKNSKGEVDRGELKKRFISYASAANAK